jgi:putative CocE/NonD family hydrolase
VDEAADGQDTVAWLRDQPWFGGQLALVGASYLAFSAWALAADPPPELTAMALYIGPHDLADAGFGHGPFELYNLLSWSDLVANQESMGPVRMLWRTMTAERRLADAMNTLPVVATGAHLDGDAPWYRDWLAHPDRSDPYWDPFRAAAALDRVTVPTLLVTGFHDFFIEQTVQQYRALRARGVPTHLTIGPWAHLTLDLGEAMRETIAWLDAYAGGSADAQPPRPRPVRVWTSGHDRWRDLPEWPPEGTSPLTWYLRAGRGLATVAADAGAADGAATSSTLRYDPADPTPSVGGRMMSVRNSGSQDNTAVEARADVLTFSTAPLTDPIEVAGVPVAEVYVKSDNPYCDVFVRLCDVDERGRSRNLTDQILRCSPVEVVPGKVRRVRLPLTDISHVFRPGHRIRLQLAGGAHPRYARNLGTDADQMQGTRTAPVTHQIQHSARYRSALILPVAPQPENAPGR